MASSVDTTATMSVGETIRFFEEMKTTAKTAATGEKIGDGATVPNFDFTKGTFLFFGKSCSEVSICFACCDPSKTKDNNTCAGCWSPAKHTTDKRLFYGRHTVNYKRLMSYLDSPDARLESTSTMQLFDVDHNYTGKVICDYKDDSFLLVSSNCSKSVGTVLCKFIARDIQRKYTQFISHIADVLEKTVRSQSRNMRPPSSSRRENHGRSESRHRNESRPPREKGPSPMIVATTDAIKKENSNRRKSRNRNAARRDESEDSGKQKQSSSSSGRAKSRSNR